MKGKIVIEWVGNKKKRKLHITTLRMDGMCKTTGAWVIADALSVLTYQINKDHYETEQKIKKLEGKHELANNK